MTILITGGAGYIGSHTARLFQQQGRDLVVLDSLEYGNAASVQGIPLEVGDIADESLVSDICRRYGVTAVVHFAAYKFVGESMEQPDKYWHNNVAGTIAMLRALRAANVQHLVFSSSCSVYGTPAAVPVDESAAIHPESVYAETKAMVERILQWQSELTDFRAVSLRYFNASGAHPDGDIGEVWDRAQNLIPLVMKSALGKSGPLQVRGDDYPTPDGTGVRDYVHVCDLAEAHAAAIDHLRRGGAAGAFNVGTGKGFSVLEVLEAAARAAGRDIPHEFAPRRAGDVAAVWGDTSKASTELGWVASRTLDDIVRTAWQWHSTHPNGYDV
ncbi:MAG: UDP-glucose 4-epimerase GalE [Actinobacteria bacterium]|nr:UDP-glucose 4-epimerase GalE [Actinomycetota bacterium]